MQVHDTHQADRLPSAIEAILFAAGEPVEIEALAEALELAPAAIEATLREMVENDDPGRGVHVVAVAGGYQLRTRAEHAAVLERFLRPAAQKLSRPALETLAIVAYRQPVTAPEVDSLRGVQSAGVIRTLLDRELIEESGRKDAPGRPYLYKTTPRFLEHFGLATLGELPELEVLLDVSNEAVDLAV